MNIKNLSLIAIFLGAVLIGCSSGDATSAEQGTTAATTGTTANVKMGKCASCGKVVAETELTSHDGAMMCKDCIASHNH